MTDHEIEIERLRRELAMSRSELVALSNHLLMVQSALAAASPAIAALYDAMDEGPEEQTPAVEYAVETIIRRLAKSAGCDVLD